MSGPPLTWENNGTARTGSDGSGSSSSSSQMGSGSSSSSSSSSNNSYSSSVTAKGELPPLPPSAPATPKRNSQQDTVRNTPTGSDSEGTQRGIRREPSDEYDEYNQQYTHPYSAQNDHSQRSRGHTRVPSDEQLPDTTMLDSVVLPAIASASQFLILLVMVNLLAVMFSCSLEYQPKRRGWH